MHPDTKRTWIQIGVAGLFLMLLGFALTAATRGTDAGLTVAGTIFAYFFGFLAIVFFSVAFHEFGHIVGAWITRTPIYYIEVLGIRFLKKPPYQDLKVQKVGGVVVSVHPRPTPAQVITVLLMGPIFTFVLLGVSIWLMINLPADESGSIPSDLLRSAAFFLMVENIILVISLLNFTHPLNDFRTIYKVMREPKEVLSDYGLAVRSQALNNLRPRDYDDEIVEMLAQSRSLPYGGHLLRFWKAMDSDRVEEAGAHIDKAYSLAYARGARDDFAPSIAYEKSMYEARFRRNREASNVAYDWGLTIDPEHHNRRGADIAREYVWGEVERAIELAREAEQVLLDQSGDHDIREHIRDWYRRIVPEMDGASKVDPA